MHVIRRRNVHRVDVLVFLLEQLPPVLVDAELREALLDPLEPAEVNIRNGDEIEDRMPGERHQIAERLAGRADAGMTEHRGGRGSAEGQERRDSGGCSDGLEKFSTGERRVRHDRQRTATAARHANPHRVVER